MKEKIRAPQFDDVKPIAYVAVRVGRRNENPRDVDGS
jgi:hypothetical protein